MTAPRLAPTIRALLGASLIAAAPAGAQIPPPGAPQAPDSVRRMLMELQQVRSELAAIQQRTIEANPELQAERKAAQQAVEAAMLEANPDIEATMERLEALGAELGDAQARQDTTRLREILVEGQRLQHEVRMAQAEALQRPDVAQKVEAYQDHLLDAMKVHDPRTEDLLARLEDLTRRLQAAASR